MVSLCFLILAAVCKSVMDKMAHHHSDSVFAGLSLWWNPAKSWRLKWKNGNNLNGERFWGSSTFFVWLTDGWHCFQMVCISFLVLAVVSYVPVYGFWVDVLLYKVVFCLAFELVYRYLLKR